ncbi:unnamed protein product [Rhizoctonia solani]|uniref:Transmembrane protein n=1 Tax=Rhizoctonia solani TaxID=456999 RepID=A0A8H3I3M8_9AGAM|nr:unnamed protein product [Rhizoctonia solani]
MSRVSNPSACAPITSPLTELTSLAFEMALMPPSSIAFEAPAPVPTIHTTFPISANGWLVSIDGVQTEPSVPLYCSALIAFFFAFIVIAMFLAVGWHRGSVAIRDVEKAEPEPTVEEVERSSIVVSIVSDTEVFSSQKKN